MCIGIMEDFIDKVIITNARKRGYLDRKYGLYGDNSSLPLSLAAYIEHNGFIQICEPPGNLSLYMSTSIRLIYYYILTYTLNIQYIYLYIHT